MKHICILFRSKSICWRNTRGPFHKCAVDYNPDGKPESPANAKARPHFCPALQQRSQRLQSFRFPIRQANIRQGQPTRRRLQQHRRNGLLRSYHSGGHEMSEKHRYERLTVGVLKWLMDWAQFATEHAQAMQGIAGLLGIISGVFLVYWESLAEK